MKSTILSLIACIVFTASSVFAIEPDSSFQAQFKILSENLQKKQEALNAAAQAYKDPNCLQALYWGKEQSKKIYALFMQCIQNGQNCPIDSQRLASTAPAHLIDLAQEVHCAKTRLEMHAKLTAQIKILEERRAKLATLSK